MNDEIGPPPPPPPPPPPMDFLPFVMAQPFSSAIEASSSALHAGSNFAWLDYDDDNKFSDKSSSGFVGLSNQGATCYMNSLIQSLYMTPEVRSALYKWTYDAENDGPKAECIPFQLQRLFARLQLCKRKYVETKDLTKSFGWLDSDAFQQHDVQELFRVLFDALERSYSRGMDLGGNSLVEHLYRGILEDYIQCTECQTTRVRTDTFFDLQLVIKDVDNILTALDKYIEPELLCNENQYTCEKCAKKVDALKGLRFKELPCLLCLQLKRFDFDWQNMQRIKLNNKVAFPVYLDISKYKHIAQNEESDGKEYLYELFAILIASGGALGGHYFTYLKSFETGKWYNFNDSSVTELENPEKDIEKMYGEDSSADKPEVSSQDKSKKQSGWGTNAYMLVYRLIDPQTNKNSTDPSEIPKELAEEIQRENDDFDQQLEKHKQRKQTLALRINVDGKAPQTVIVQRSFTIRETTKAVWEAMIEESQRDALPLECVRLRDYNIHKKVPSATFTGQEESSLSQLQFHQNKNLWFETRKPGEPFLNEDTMMLNIVKVPAGKNYQEEAPVPTFIPSGSNLGGLKKILAEKFDIPVDNLCVIKVAGSVHANLLAGDEKDLKKDIGLLDGGVLFIEHSEFPTDASKSSIAKQVEASQYMIEISFNLPDEKTYDQELIIDKRSSVKDLKAMISAMLGLSVNEFKMIKNLVKHEYKREDQSLEEAGFFDCAVVIIERGEPLTADQFQIKLFEYDYDKIEPWKSHDQVVLSANILMKDLKVMLSENLQIPIDEIRLRGKDGARATSVFNDDDTLKQSIPQLYDGKEVVVQRVNPGPDGMNTMPFPSENQVLIELQQWVPSKWELGKRFEEIIPKDCSIIQLKSLLSARCDIPVDSIAVGKPRRYQMKDISQLPLLVWDHPDDALLSQNPFSTQDGELLLFKDLRDAEKVPLDELKGEKPSTPVTQERVHVPEPSIKIRTRYDKPLPEKEKSADTPMTDVNAATAEQVPPTKKLKEDGTSQMEEDIIVQSS